MQAEQYGQQPVFAEMGVYIEGSMKVLLLSMGKGDIVELWTTKDHTWGKTIFPTFSNSESSIHAFLL
eukprot:c16311_g1_i1 orf=2-202(-)